MLNINLLNKPWEQVDGVDEKIILSSESSVIDSGVKEQKLESNQKETNNAYQFLIIITLILAILAYYYLVIV